MPVEVILEESDMSRYSENYEGIRCYFVVIQGVPYNKGLIVTDAKPLAQAEKIKAAVEAALKAYKQPVKPEKPTKKVRTRFARIR